MNILLINHEYPPVGGGAGVAMYHLARALSDKGHRVRVLTCGSPAGTSNENGVEIERIPVAANRSKLAGPGAWLTFLIRAPRVLQRMVQEEPPDVLNAHFAFPAGWVAARAQTGIPLVTSVIGADIHDPTRRVSADRNPLIRRAVRTAFRNSRAVTADSEDLASRTRALFPSVAPRVVHFGIPLLQPDPRQRKNLKIPIDQISLVTLGRLVRRKRIDRLIAAMAAVRPHRLHLTVLGDGPQRAPLERQVQTLGLQEQVQFRGYVSEADKAAILGNADLFCLPSEHEGFGLAFLEAMSLGLPVLTTGSGGQIDIVQNGVNGFLLDDNRAETLSAQLEAICETPVLLSSMRQAARNTAARFSPEQAADGFIRVYETDESCGKKL